MATTTIHEFGTIFPKSTQVIVVISGVDRVGLIGVGAICGIGIIQKAAHAKTLVVDDAVAVANAVEGLVVPDSKSVVDAVVVLIRTFKEVNANCGW